MSEWNDLASVLNVRLKPSESSTHPRTNYTNVGGAPGIADLVFWLHRAHPVRSDCKTAKDGQTAPKGLEGALVTRMAIGMDVTRLHQQIQRVIG